GGHRAPAAGTARGEHPREGATDPRDHRAGTNTPHREPRLVTSRRRGTAADSAFPSMAIPQTLSAKSPPLIRQTLSGNSETPSRTFKREYFRGLNSESPIRDSMRELTHANVDKLSTPMPVRCTSTTTTRANIGRSAVRICPSASSCSRRTGSFLAMLEALPNKTLPDRSTLPQEKRLGAEIEKTRQRTEAR